MRNRRAWGRRATTFSESGGLSRPLAHPIENDVRHFKGFGVVKGSVAAAMANGDRVVPGNLIEVVGGKLPPVLNLSVIEEIAFDPGSWGVCAARARNF